jgi:hypothetical protein
MTKRPDYTREQVIEALTKTGGFLTESAKALGCCYRTIYNYIKKDPTIADEIEQIKENRLDIAESRLMALMDGVDSKLALTAIMFYLKHCGRGRGYIESSKIEISENISNMMQAAEERTK